LYCVSDPVFDPAPTCLSHPWLTAPQIGTGRTKQ